MSYKIGDFIISIKNSALSRRRLAVLPYSKVNKNIAEVLVKEGFLASVKEDAVGGKKVLSVVLKFNKRIPAVRDVNIISKPSLRIYSNAKKLFEIKRRGRHKVILSTSKGIMEATKAQKEGVGGEILFTIWS